MKTLLLAILLSGAALAESPAAPCAGFKWPMAREVAAVEAAPGSETASGTVMTAWPEGALRLALTAGGDAAFPIPPERAPKAETASGYVTLPAPEKPGTYQVSLGTKAWIDVVQDGKSVKSGDHSSDANCPAIRKSVRFDLVAAPVTLQISGSDATSIVLTIMPAAD